MAPVTRPNPPPRGPANPHMARDEDTEKDPCAPFRTGIDAAVDAIVFADANGRVTYANPATERLLGYERTELVGVPLRTLVRGATPGTGAAELTAIRKDGHRVTVELSISVHDDVVTAIFRDIGRRKAAESALARSEALLEQTVQL